jgi:hypothetical protein
MKKLYITVLTLALLAPVLRASAQTCAHPYLQASAIYALIGDDFKSGPGVALAAGVSITKHHSVEVEAILFNTETKDSYYSYYYNDKTTLKFTPLLLTYRYTFTVNEKFGAFAGFSVGAAFVKYDRSSNSPYYYYTSSTRSGTDTVLAGGPQIGCGYKFSNNSSITATLRALFIDTTTVALGGNLLIFQLGYRFTF